MISQLQGLLGWDRAVTLAINGIHSNFTDGLWTFFSDKLVWIPLYAAVVGLLFWRLGWKRALVFIAAIILTIVCCDQLSNVFKYGFARPRPCVDPVMVASGLHIVKQGGGFGFFSAHAANAFGFAYCSFIALRSDRRLRYRGFAAFIFIWAILVSLSRVFVSMHFFGDILVGTAVGCILGAAWGRLARYCIDRWIVPSKAE